jgi:AraC family transcriptional regulator
MQQQTLNLSVVAAQLVEAACYARAGNCENAHVHIAHAIALLQGKPVPAPQVRHVPRVEERPLPRGSLLAWQKRRLIEHVDGNLGRRITVNELAALLHLSSSHFHRVFKCAFGVAPHRYLARRRIEVAQGLMLTTDHTLSEIALQCGLADQSHLSRWFRRVVGETPHAWRRIRRCALEEQNSDPAGAIA